MSKTRTALILTGGGARGAFEAGAISAIMKKVPIDLIIGTSIGAINGAFIAGGGNPQDLEDIWSAAKFENLIPHEATWGSLLEKKAVIDEQKFVQFLQDTVPVRKFEQCKIPLFINAFNWTKKEEVTFHKGNLLPAILASSALYPLFPVITIDDETYSDTLKVPHLLDQYQECKFERAIVINLYGSMTPTWNFKKFLLSVINAMSKKTLYEDIDEISNQGVKITHIESDAIIRPDDFSHTKELIEDGRKKAEQALKNL